MNSGVIKVADQDGVYVIKLEGDVRLTLSLSFDDFINQMFADEAFCSVIFDLTEAQAIDSTTLGLMAKISLMGRSLDFMDPIVIAVNPGIRRLLSSMGFQEIFQIVESTDLAAQNFEELSCDESRLDENKIKAKVIEAHKALIDMNAQNRETFKELMQSLDAHR
jgi:anti-anti-sigma factor